MRICLAPMDGITDCAYRVICKRIFEQHGNPDDELMLWTEFMSADGYWHNPPGVIKHLLKTDYDHETIVQIFGGNTETLVHCAQDLDKKYDFAGIELNMGCPSPKIMKCAAGSGMLKDKKKTLDIVKMISKTITTPFSLKVRIGLTHDDIDEQFQFLLDASKYVKVISIHGRTYKQSHSGEVNRDFIYRLKEKLPNNIIIGNGGLRSYEQAQEQLQNLDGMMVAQSAIGNPRVLTPHAPTPTERLTTIIEHLNLACAAEIYFKETIPTYEEKGKLIMPTLAQLTEMTHDLGKHELQTPILFRKYLFNYIQGLANGKQLKQKIIKIREYEPLITLLQEYFQTIK